MLYRCCYILLLFRCETRHIDSCWFFVCCWLHCNWVVPGKNIPFLNRCFCNFFFWILFWFYTIYSFGAMYNFCIDVLYFFLNSSIYTFLSMYNFFFEWFFFYIHLSSIYTFCLYTLVYLQFFYLQLCQAAGAIKRIPGI